nr:retrotransposon protein, putative, Ty1-copia subclass [Tanacetum cinerariifolium]
MMNLTTLPLSYWDYALESATRILNMVPTKKVDKTPYELWYGKVPNLSYLNVWGCEVLVKRDTLDKLQQRSVKCIFIGYPKEIMGYYFYFPPKNKIVVARYAEFFEKNLITQEVSGRAIDLEEIQDEDTSPFKITSEIPMETVGSKWIFKKMTGMDGIVHTYKARLVAKDYTQLYGVDYEETFLPVADIRVIRILISIAAFVRSYNMHNMGKIIGELHALLFEYEIGLPKKAATPQVMVIQSGRIQKANNTLNAKGNNKEKSKGKDKSYIPKNKNPKPSAKENPTKDDACNHCKNVGHCKRIFHAYLADLIKKKKQVGTASSSATSLPLQTIIVVMNICIYLNINMKFETFKVFKNEVENQLEKTIKALRSDRGGKYISQEFKDYLKAYEIIQQLTPPYTPQYNEVSKRRNRTLLDMA